MRFVTHLDDQFHGRVCAGARGGELGG